MGVIEEIDKLELSDEVKDRLKQEAQSEIDSLTTDNDKLRRQGSKSVVEEEIKDLGALGFSEAPGLLKYVRRIYLSDDKEPGLVLLSDTDLELSDEEKTGASSREEITLADAVRQIFKLMPRTEEGKLKIQLSDQGLEGEAGDKPDDGSEPDAGTKRSESRGRLGTAIGREIKPRDRSKRYGHAITSGGDA